MSFGHGPCHPFGHGPFGYSCDVKIWDLAHNPLTSGETAQMLGWIEPLEVPTEQEHLGLRIYPFLLGGIKEEDKHNHFFFKRYLEGPEAMWAAIQAKIFAIKDLWSIVSVDNAYLPYVKRIVGWTKETDSITESLDNNTLRRLIATSVALWKKRGPEDALDDILLLTTNARLKLYNWFDYRWITAETEILEDRKGYDSWMIGSPGSSEYAEYTSVIRIVDDGTLDTDLVVNIVKLMRACSERWEIYYIKFLDLFISDADNSQWTYFNNTLTVSDGTAKFETSGNREIAVVTTDEDYSNYVVYSRIRGSSLTFNGMFGVVFYCDGTEDNFYAASINTNLNLIQIHKVVNGAKYVITSFDYSIYGTLTDDEWYGLRIQISPETIGSSINRIKVYLDSNEILNFTDSTFSNGTFGFWHETTATIEVDEVEMFTLPLNSDTVDVNS